MSLGRAWLHRLPDKLHQAAAHGYSGLEIFYEDLEYHAKDLYASNSTEHLLLAATGIANLCAQLRLEVICLQPLMHYEGLIDPTARALARDRADLYFQLARALGTDLVAVPSNFLPAKEASGDRALIVADLKALARRAASFGLRITYEALCWGTHIDTWEASWEVVQAVDEANFGICLDTYNILGRIYADPTMESGTIGSNANEAVRQSMDRLRRDVDIKKIFYIQVVDAERLPCPLVHGHEFYDASQPARMSWSRNCRLFYGETGQGAYLPVERVLRTIFHDLKWRGWISMELFNRSMVDASPETPYIHAQRGAAAWEKIEDVLRHRIGHTSVAARL